MTNITTVPAVVAICDRCSRRSNPMDPDKVAGFEKYHQDLHQKQDRRDQMAERGHEIEIFDIDPSCDDTTGRARCSCGTWESRKMKACNLDDEADRHLVEIEAIMASANQD